MVMPNLDEIGKMEQSLTSTVSDEVLALENEISEDVRVKSDILRECKLLPTISAKYAAKLAKLEHAEFQADERTKSIRSKIVLAFEDNPKAFIENVRHRNMQIVEAVYRSHPQYKEAVQEQLKIACLRKMVAQTAYAIDQKRTMLEALVNANIAGKGIVMADAPPSDKVKEESTSL